MHSASTSVAAAAAAAIAASTATNFGGVSADTSISDELRDLHVSHLMFGFYSFSLIFVLPSVTGKRIVVGAAYASGNATFGYTQSR